MENYLILGKELALPDGFSTKIETHFKPLYLQLEDLKAEFKAVNDLEITEENINIFKECRLKFVKIRTATAKEHKFQKTKVLQIGKAYDSVKNLITENVVNCETKLKEKETFFERKEQERINKLEEERIKELKLYNIDGLDMYLGRLDESVYKIMVKGFKADFEDAKEQKKKEIFERVEREAKEREERELFKIEQDKLKREREILKAEQKKINEKARVEKEETDRILRIEREAKEKLEKELEQRKNDERLKQLQIEADELAKKQAPDKEKFSSWLDHYSEIGIPGFSNNRFMSLAVCFQERIKSVIKDFEDKL